MSFVFAIFESTGSALFSLFSGISTVDNRRKPGRKVSPPCMCELVPSSHSAWVGRSFKKKG